MATIKDVAKEAGVSIATVSAVINGTRFVAKPTKKRVVDAVARLGYQPNRMARALKQKKSHMIAHILPSVMNPFFPAALKGVEDAAFAAGYSVLVCNTEANPERIQRYTDLLLETQVDGVVITAPGLRSIHDMAETLHRSGIPVVVLSGPRSLKNFDRVLVDDVQCGYLAAQHLLEAGHGNLGFIQVARSTTSKHRLQGVCEALQVKGAKQPALVLEAHGFTEQEGYRLGVDFASRHEKPTAMVASNDMLAVGFSEALHDSGLTIPKHLSLVGIDNTMAASLRPRLSSVAIPAYDMGLEAVRRLIARMDGSQQGTPLTTTLNPSIVEGHSVVEVSVHSVAQNHA